MQLANNVADVRMFRIVLQTLGNDFDRVHISAMLVDSRESEARFIFCKQSAAHYLKALARFVVIVCRFLGCQNCSVARESFVLNDGIERRVAGGEKVTDERNRFDKFIQ